MTDVNGDTIIPSRETFFLINKTLLETKTSQWDESIKLLNFKYKILFDSPDKSKVNLELLGITTSNELFFKTKENEKYLITPIDYKIKTLGDDYPH